MGNVTGIQFEKNGKLYYFDSNGFNLKIGDYAIVDTVRGLDLGEVIMASREVAVWVVLSMSSLTSNHLSCRILTPTRNSSGSCRS